MNSSKRISDLISLKGRVSLVTGGSGHIGSAISEALAELGSDIIIASRKREMGSRFALALSEEFGINAVFEEVNLHSKESIDSFFKKKRRVDILVNNAFTWPTVLKLEETSWDDFEYTLQNGVTSPFYLTKRVIETMREDGGNIINIASMYGVVSPNFRIYRDHQKLGNALAYNAAKAAIIQMTRYLAAYCAKWNIRVNCVSPGPFPKPGTFSDGKEWFETELKEMNPLHKLGEPWQLKGVIALLASDLGSYITGQNILVDGGWTIW